MELIKIILFVLFLLIMSVCQTIAQSSLSENEALKILNTKIGKDNLYSKWTRMECLSFFPEDGNNGYFDFAIIEKHGGKCSGDPNTAPIVDRFRISRTTKEIQ